MYFNSFFEFFAYSENPIQKEHDKQLFEFESNFWDVFINDEYSMEFTDHIGYFIKSVEIFAQYKYFQEHIFGVGVSRYF